MTALVFAVAVAGLALLLVVLALVGQSRHFWLLGLWRKQWVTGRIHLADPDNGKLGRGGILGVVESHAVEGRMWLEQRSDRVSHPVSFAPTVGAGALPLGVSRARMFLNARRRYTHIIRNSMEVERMLRAGDAVTLVLDRELRVGNDSYRSAATIAAAPVAIFAGSAGEARWRLLRETIWLLAPFVLIVATCGWAIHSELELDRAFAEARCTE